MTTPTSASAPACVRTWGFPREYEILPQTAQSYQRDKYVVTSPFFFRLSKVSYCTNKTRGSQMTQCCVKDNTRPWCSYSCFVTCSHFLPVFSSLPHDVAKFLFLASISHVSTCHIVTMYHPVYFHITCLSLQPGLLKTVGHIGRRGGYL